MASEPVTQNGAEIADATDKNAQAKADADNLLAQLQTKSAPSAPATEEAAPEKSGDAKVEKTNGSEEKAVKKDEDDTYRKERRDREDERERHDHRHEDRKPFHRGGGRGRGGRGGGGRGGFKDKRNNNRFDPSTQTESDDPVAIRKQVEFYFSDSNLPLDKFLLTQVGGAENKPVELDVICSFKRMRQFQPREAVVKALKESTFLDLVEDDTKVQRKTPLPEEFANGAPETVVKVFEDRAMPRSIYAKGFGEEQPSTQFDIEAFFAPYGPTNAIRLRRKDLDKSFKGSVFVEFDSEETMKKFLDIDPKPEYQGRKLQILTKKEYCDQKAADIASGKIRASSPSGGTPRKRTRDDDRDWRDRRADDSRKDRDTHRGRGRGHGSRGGRGRDRDGDNRRSNRDRDREGRNQDPSENDRDAANAEAVAKAKAFVEAEKAREAAAEATSQPAETKANAEEANDQTAEEVSKGTKRAREEDENGIDTAAKAEAEEGREAKKVDVK